MDKVKNYIQESYVELTEKVTWPSLQELQKSAVIVLIASMLIALILLVMDLAANRTLEMFYDSF